MKVSVVMMTYNHERFIGRAIESVISQHADFPFELIIGEDCSTDSTREVVIRYAQKYPQIIKALLPNQNRGPVANLFAILEQTKGKYLAYLEGDDFWINSYKLQMQVRFLDDNPASGGCFSDSFIVNENNDVSSYTYYANQPKPVPSYSTDDIIRIVGITPANTLVFRRSVLDNIPGWFRRLPCHSGLELLITLKGSLNYLDQAMGARRIHPGGIWAAQPLLYRMHYSLLYKKSLIEDTKLNAQYGQIIFDHMLWDVKRILDEIVSNPSVELRDVGKTTNINLDGIAKGFDDVVQDERLFQLSALIGDAAHQLMAIGRLNIANWLHKLAFEMAPANESVRGRRVSTNSLLAAQ